MIILCPQRVSGVVSLYLVSIMSTARDIPSNEPHNLQTVKSVRDTLKGMTAETCRGNLFFRKIANQLSCSSYFG
jgi:hypothetical protein